MHRLSRTVAVVLAAGLGAVGAVPAVAAPSADVAALGVGQPAQIAATSPFFAGYVGTDVGEGVTSADFVVPEYTCGDTDAGIVTTVWAITAEGEFQAGPDLFSYCSGGEFVLNGHVTTSGGQIPIWQQLEPGDKVRMSIARRSVGPSTHDISFTNLTRGWTSLLPTNSPIDRIEIGHRRMSLDGVRLEPPTYDAVFTRVLFDDVKLADAGATRTHLVDDEGDRLIGVSRPHKAKFGLSSQAG